MGAISVRIKFRVIKDTGAKRKFGVDLADGQRYFVRRDGDTLKLGANAHASDVGYFELNDGRPVFKRSRENTSTVRVNGEELFERMLKRADLISFEGYTLEMIEVPGPLNDTAPTIEKEDSPSLKTPPGTYATTPVLETPAGATGQVPRIIRARLQERDAVTSSTTGSGAIELERPASALARPTALSPGGTQASIRVTLDRAPPSTGAMTSTSATSMSTRATTTRRKPPSTGAKGAGLKAILVTGIVAATLSAAVLIYQEAGPALTQQAMQHVSSGLGLVSRRVQEIGRGPASAQPGAQRLFELAQSGQNDALLNFLQTTPVNLNLTFSNGKTALHEASARGHVGVIQLLVKAGARIEMRDQSGNTPLMTAVIQNQFASFVELLRSGADIEARRRADGSRVLEIATQLQRNEFLAQLKLLEVPTSQPDGQPASSPASRPQ